MQAVSNTYKHLQPMVTVIEDTFLLLNANSMLNHDLRQETILALQAIIKASIAAYDGNQAFSSLMLNDLKRIHSMLDGTKTINQHMIRQLGSIYQTIESIINEGIDKESEINAYAVAAKEQAIERLTYLLESVAA